MSRQFRHRTAGVALVALFAAAPLLEASPGYAGPVRSGQQVIFGNRGVFGLSCRAEPDVRALMVPAESTIQVVNDTGHGADLLLDGRSQGAIPERGSTPVVFRRGTVSMALQPDCLVESGSDEVVVTTSPSAPPSPTAGPPSSSPSPSVSSSASVGPVPSHPRPTTPTVSVSVSHGPSAPPRSAAATSTPRESRTPGTGRPGSRPRATAGVVVTRSAPRGNDVPRRRTWATTEPSRTPSAVATTPDPPPSADAAPGVVPDPSSSADPSTVGPPVEPAAEAVADLRPLTRTGGTGLLALMALVCVTGVMAGAVRTIAAQRASRANMA